jgi:succinyl-CoA synthetase alpha subunit
MAGIAGTVSRLANALRGMTERAGTSSDPMVSGHAAEALAALKQYDECEDVALIDAVVEAAREYVAARDAGETAQYLSTAYGEMVHYVSLLDD